MFGPQIESLTKKEWSHSVFPPASVAGCVYGATGAFAPSKKACPFCESGYFVLRCRVAPRYFLGMSLLATYFPEKCCKSEHYFVIRIVTQIRQQFIPKFYGFH
jgi:hypothetical protein